MKLEKKVIKINESDLIKIISNILRESYSDLDEVSEEIYDYVKTHPNDRFIMSEEEIINFRNQTEQEVVDKPEGLWYVIGSEWIDWVRSQMPEWETENVFSINIDESKIKKISSYDEIIEFTKKYGKKTYGFLMIDWRKVAMEYSGIEIAPYIRKASRELNWYYTWDIASGCIWNQDGVKSIKKIDSIPTT